MTKVDMNRCKITQPKPKELDVHEEKPKLNRLGRRWAKKQAQAEQTAERARLAKYLARVRA